MDWVHVSQIMAEFFALMSAMPCVHVIRPIDYVPYAVPTRSFVSHSSSVVAEGGWGGGVVVATAAEWGFRAPSRHSRKKAACVLGASKIYVPNTFVCFL